MIIFSLFLLLSFVSCLSSSNSLCPSDEYAYDGGGLIQIDCGGDAFTVPFEMQEYEAVFIGTIPNSTINVRVNITSDVDIDIALMRKGYNPLDPRDIFPPITNESDP